MRGLSVAQPFSTGQPSAGPWDGRCCVAGRPMWHSHAPLCSQKLPQHPPRPQRSLTFCWPQFPHLQDTLPLRDLVRFNYAIHHIFMDADAHEAGLIHEAGFPGADPEPPPQLQMSSSSPQPVAGVQ